MALTDIDRILRNYENRDYAAGVYRIQFCSEKILKGLILLYGAQFKKIHTPSIIIRDEILSVFSELSKIETKHLNKIIDNAKILEDLSTIPRYGVNEKGHFIEPEVIYKEESSIFSILPHLIRIITNLLEILKIHKQKIIWKQILEAFKNGFKRLQSLID